MNWKSTVRTLSKVIFTVAVFVAIFAEFGGGPVAVTRQGVLDGTVFYQANPEMPGLVGKLKAKFNGTSLPEATVPLAGDKVCKAGAEGGVYVQTQAGGIVPFKALRHCVDDKLLRVYPSVSGELSSLDQTSGEAVYLYKQGFQLVPMDMHDLWAEITSIEPAVFIPWFVFAILIKLVGIFANIYRWQVLLRGQAEAGSATFAVRFASAITAATPVAAVLEGASRDAFTVFADVATATPDNWAAGVRAAGVLPHAGRVSLVPAGG